tara:strand:- start:347 stop:1405 length:1059 start_codon:yes stop_codon:yes gene_type:complete
MPDPTGKRRTNKVLAPKNSIANDVDTLTEMAYLDLVESGTSNNRLVGEWAMQPEGEQDMLELHNYTMVLRNPWNCVGRHFGAKHVGIIIEFFDVIRGDNPGFIHREWKFYEKWMTLNNTPFGTKHYPYTYGIIINGASRQWKECVRKLKENMNTRHAGIVCWNTDGWCPDADGVHHRDFVPCTYQFHFQVIDGKLCMTTMMRSQDALKGWWLDCFLYSNLAMMMADELDIPVGHYTVFQNNFHVYPSDRAALDTFLSEFRLYPGPTEGSLAPKLSSADSLEIHTALLHLYSAVEKEEPLYTVEHIERIREPYWRSLLAIVFTKYDPKNKELEKYMVSTSHSNWRQNIINEVN